MGRRTGFTLIELLVVVAILATLFSLVVVTVGPFLERAQVKATVSIIRRLESWAEEYRSLKGSYPKDGLDEPYESDTGTRLRGVGALHYQLSRSVIADDIVGSRVRLRELPPVASIKSAELSDDYDGVFEIIDGFGEPMHYDNVANDRFVPQDGSVHFPPVTDWHPDDPRAAKNTIDGKEVVRRRGIQNRGRFDIWSHGPRGHDEEEPECLPMGTWNLTQFES